MLGDKSGKYIGRCSISRPWIGVDAEKLIERFTDKKMNFSQKHKNSSAADLKARYEEIKAELKGMNTEDGGISDSDWKKASPLLDEQDYIKAALAIAHPFGSGAGRSVSTYTPADSRNINYAKIGQDIQAMLAASAPADYDKSKIGAYPIGQVDARLRGMRAAATGANETIPSDGGYLVGEDLEAAIMDSVFAGSPLLRLLRTRELSSGSNRLVINAVDETSRVDGSRWGGVQGYWLAEAAEKTASKSKYRQIIYELKKVAALTYLTDELLQDAVTLAQDIIDTHSEELRFKIQDSVINGNGAGKPQGVLNSGALISVDKEAGQAAASIVWENIVKMFSRYIGGPGVWLINRDIIPSLYSMNLAVGTAGVPVYLPSSQGGTDGAANRPLSTLMGWPVIEIEQAATVGSVGDIILMDPKAYMLATKRGVQSAMSMHVRFVYDETVLRSVARVDGSGLLNSAITPFKGSATRSPFIALAERA